MQVLQKMQVHSFGSQIFMAELETSKNSALFKSAGTYSHILGPREPNDFVL